MDATRPHLSFPAEWITAAVFLLATLAVGLLIVSELRVPRAPVGRESAAPARIEPSVPDDAVAAPKLMLGGGVELAVGEPADQATMKLAAAAETSRVSERGPLGAREIRSYELAGTRFIIVFEPFERNGETRVAGIYLR